MYMLDPDNNHIRSCTLKENNQKLSVQKDGLRQSRSCFSSFCTRSVGSM